MSDTASNKQIFTTGEGDRWHQRNLHRNSLSNRSDLLIPMLTGIDLPDGKETTVLEVGCSSGWRLQKLKDLKGWSVSGIDPSLEATAMAQDHGLAVIQGTADRLPYKDATFDLLIFGFCLYLCDREDLFKIAAEADRVLKPNSWIGIIDFWAANHRTNTYSHHPEITTHKDDMSKMFTWHPCYMITDHIMRHHEHGQYTDSSDEWTAASIIRRRELEGGINE